MCELFAMSSLHPTTVTLSLEEFSRHGGLTGPHKDGWGIGWYEEKDVRLVKEAFPAASSPCVRFIQDNPFSTQFALCHIRRATRGPVSVRNCQPFARELGGVWHCFAHNGDLQDIFGDPGLRPQRFRPVGETDSEVAFCALMDLLAPIWSRADGVPPLDERVRVVAGFAARLRELGPANFLYCDGDALFAHGDRRHQEDGTIRAPGLWRLARRCPAGTGLQADGLRMVPKEHDQEVVLLASVPLTAEGWQPLAQGELLVAGAGHVRAIAPPGAEARVS